ncbi:MAG TPA: flagellar filament capping protein FliD, partial [Candidatus Acidoferrales bacterium]|nr:flagellar filament capping protein FliD [Candidatus Acidoferrales bacterium]
MSTTNGVAGTNVPPITFPGVVSGIDYNSIINEMTSLSMQPTVALNASVATLNNANVELVKINNLLQSVQNALGNLSNPNLFDTYDGTSTDSAALTATGTPGTAAVPGSYTISKVQTATSTSVVSSATAGHSITDVLTSGPYSGQASNTVPLVDSYASVTPTNGSGSLGQITIDGVAISYNVDTQSLNQILNAINSAVQTVDPGFSATLVGGTVQFTSTDAPISLGSPSDSGNLLDVLKLSNSQLNNTANSGSIVGSGDVGGINEDTTFSDGTAAGYKTPVTAGYFTINGVKITVSSGNNTSDILNAINNSNAGVVATYDQNGQITLTATQTGPQGIVLGASGDTSNFLAAAGLTAATGAATSIGSQAEVDVQTASGATQKYYSNSNSVTSAIPGITLNLQSSTTTPFVVTVSQDTSQLVSALQSFVTAYNAAVSEINAATAPPVVTAAAAGSGGSAQSFGGGVLFGNSDAQTIVQQLETLTSGFLGSGAAYNSLSQIGLSLSDTFSTLTTGNNSDSQGNTGGQAADGTQSGATVQQTTYEGTDGTLQPLNVQQFLSALQSNPTAVSNLINGASGLTTQLGSYLTSVTGTPTLLNSGLVGTIPNVSIIQNFENTNTDAISNYQQQIQQITDTANTQA